MVRNSYHDPRDGSSPPPRPNGLIYEKGDFHRHASGTLLRDDQTSYHDQPRGGGPAPRGHEIPAERESASSATALPADRRAATPAQNAIPGPTEPLRDLSQLAVELAA